ncbi:RusA family crossover junction endodeoxyribonuclease [Shinella sp. BYT-45]|uniref:RusA family crossover junction endodeoxyribonuclease n=1 Tax=Shinella sp. BYT-45 TaxID=3377377 RepID=UPI00397F4516
MEPELPLELLIRGYPISHQTKRKSALEDWKRDVHDQARSQMDEGHFALQGLLTATVYFFPQTTLEPDLDNAAKPILDGLCECIYMDDRQIERLVIQRFEPGRPIPLTDDSFHFNAAVASLEPIVYIRLEAFDEEQT